MWLQTGSSDSERTEKGNFSNWVLSNDNECIGEKEDENINLQIPEDMLINNSGDSLASIIERTYPNFLDNFRGPSFFFQNRAILTPKYKVVDRLNEYMLSMVPGEAKTYLIFDRSCSTHENIDTPDDVHTPEFLNTITALGHPNHKLTLKVGVPIMLLRNIDQFSGLCNGTRLIITQMGKYVLEAKVITGSNDYQKKLQEVILGKRFLFQHYH